MTVRSTEPKSGFSPDAAPADPPKPDNGGDGSHRRVPQPSARAFGDGVLGDGVLSELVPGGLGGRAGAINGERVARGGQDVSGDAKRRGPGCAVMLDGVTSAGRELRVFEVATVVAATVGA